MLQVYKFLFRWLCLSSVYVYIATEIHSQSKAGLSLEQASSVYEETLSQGRFMEDDYFR